ncbi:hypothetical protein BKA93DRAFT_36918 [Sparassis latifolia]|uniref:Mitochondrial import protein n=1 Tax=Sparassis crispa TaxID=139825 RepID=A0A401H1C8_9APHY|nr:hypothetical protein SCP_1300320 [Sparassis crispa]GBE88218.1 hypothetical protein SCP_1300320 [Sparassis crispa]
MAEHLNQEEETLLQSALSTAFTPIPLPHQAAHTEPPQVFSESVTAAAASSVPGLDLGSSGEPESGETVWKAEYEAHVAEWRQRSAEQRQKAEEERARWEAIRREEKSAESEADVASTHGKGESGWESLGASGLSGATAATSPSLADVRDLVSGEGQGAHTKVYLDTVLPGSSQRRGTSEPESPKHDKWEDIPSSLASSYPSMSFPSDPHSPSSSHPHALPPHARSHPHDHPAHHQAPAHGDHHHASHSTTLAVFDSTLSPRTRVLALLSSLAINFFLPFVNGVMLGCGEVFAKHVIVGWLGWPIASTKPGSLAANVGLGRSKGKDPQREQTRNSQ